MPAPNLIEVTSVHFDGYLEKQKRFSTWAWSKYWFTIDEGQLNYYKDETCKEGVGLLDLGQSCSIKAVENQSRSHCFEITMKDRGHIFCAESLDMRDKWVRLLQQAQLLRPRRSSSMMRPRCNSIDENCTPDQILSVEDLEPPGTPTSPPVTPNTPRAGISVTLPASTSPPSTPTNPFKFGSPKFHKATKPQTNSPKIQQKAAGKTPHSPKTKKFLDQPSWVLPKSSVSSDKVKLKNFRRLQSDSSLTMTEDEEKMAEKKYTVRANSVFYVSYLDGEEDDEDLEQSMVNSNNNIVKKGPANNQGNDIDTKLPVLPAKSNKLPVTRVFTGPITGLTSNGIAKSNKKSVVSRTVSSHTVVSRAATTRPVSGPAHIARSRPVTGERPVIENRMSKSKSPSLSTSSAESDSESSSSSRKLKRLMGTGSTDTSRGKSDLIPSKSSHTGVVLRHNFSRAKSMPHSSTLVQSEPSSDSDDTDIETDKEFGVEDEVFSTSPPAAASSPFYRTKPQDDAYYEKLHNSIREPKPPIPSLPYPRLELTFRSAFDDIRLFLANNRNDDEIFPVPRKSERGGKAIKKLKKFLLKVS